MMFDEILDRYLDRDAEDVMRLMHSALNSDAEINFSLISGNGVMGHIKGSTPSVTLIVASICQKLAKSLIEEDGTPASLKTKKCIDDNFNSLNEKEKNVVMEMLAFEFIIECIYDAYTGLQALEGKALREKTFQGEEAEVLSKLAEMKMTSPDKFEEILSKIKSDK